jgi:hypothetical protein
VLDRVQITSNWPQIAFNLLKMPFVKIGSPAPASLSQNKSQIANAARPILPFIRPFVNPKIAH